MTSGSKVMCRKIVDTPWPIYRDFTVHEILFGEVMSFLNLDLTWTSNEKYELVLKKYLIF